MINNDFLDLNIGDRRKVLTIVDIERLVIRGTPKIIFECLSEEGQVFKLDEALVRNSKGSLVCKGFWASKDPNGCWNKDGAISKVLSFYKKKTLRELLNMKIEAYPKPNDFLVLISCSFDEKLEIKW